MISKCNRENCGNSSSGCVEQNFSSTIQGNLMEKREEKKAVNCNCFENLVAVVSIRQRGLDRVEIKEYICE